MPRTLEKPFKCPAPRCKHAYAGDKSLRRHLRTGKHTGDLYLFITRIDKKLLLSVLKTEKKTLLLLAQVQMLLLLPTKTVKGLKSHLKTL